MLAMSECDSHTTLSLLVCKEEMVGHARLVCLASELIEGRHNWFVRI